MNFYLAITNQCNMSCKYCYVPKYNKNKPVDDKLVVERTQQLVDKLQQAHVQIGAVVLHGAEPLLVAPETVMQLHEVLYKDTPRQLRIQTNGLNMTEEYLKKLDPERIGFSVSLDGYRTLNDKNRAHYDKILRNIRTAKQLGFSVSVISVITKETICRIEQFMRWVQYMLQLVDRVTFKLVHGGGELSQTEQELLVDKAIQYKTARCFQFLRDGICLNAGNQCEWYEFDVDGRVYGCNKTFNDDECIGNWIDMSVQEILQKRAVQFAHEPVDSECLQCELYHVCRGGCPNDRVEEKSVDCYARKKLYQYRVEHNLPILHR